MCPIVHWFDSCCHFTALTYWTWFSLLPLVFPLVPEENLSAKWNRDSRLILVAPFQTICHTSQFFTVLEVWCLVTTLHDWLFYYFVCVFSPFLSLFFMCMCDLLVLLHVWISWFYIWFWLTAVISACPAWCDCCCNCDVLCWAEVK